MYIDLLGAFTDLFWFTLEEVYTFLCERKMDFLHLIKKNVILNLHLCEYKVINIFKMFM